MKKVFTIIFIGILLLGALYGMKVYTDSFSNNSKSKAGINERNNINRKKDNDKNITDIKQSIDNINEQEKISNKEEGQNKYNNKIDEENAADKKEDEVEYNEQNNFTLIDLEGNQVSLSDYKGKKVFLNFWATWCPPCRGEMPYMEMLHNNIDDSEVVILAVSLDDDEKLVKRFIESEEFTFKVLQDKNSTVGKKYMVSSIPTSYLIDKNGEIIKRVVGAMNLEQMQEFIK